MNNLKIRKTAKEKNIKLWQIADKLQMNDGNFSRLLRHELPKEKSDEILHIIEDLTMNGSRGVNSYESIAN